MMCLHITYSVLLDTTTGEVWVVNWDDFPKIKWKKGGQFVNFGKELSK